MRVIYTGRFGYPTSAAGIRVKEIAKQLSAGGVRVDMLCDTVQPDGEYEADNAGIRYSFIQTAGKGRINFLKQLLDIVFGNKIFRAVISEIEKEKPVAVVLYNDAYMLTKRLIPYCRKRGIRVVGDVTEWYERPRMSSLNDRLIPFLTDKRILYVDRKLDSVISISPYLMSYYANIGVETAFIPPIVTASNMHPPEAHDGLIHLTYAGSPGEKDLIFPVINAVSQINELEEKFVMDIYGVTKKDLCIDEIYKGVIFHGRVDHEEVLKALRMADFSFLLRRDLRYAKAGFSTKFVECMSHGVAMICNRVGGADAILTDRVDGILLNDASQDTLLRILSELSSWNRNQIQSMRFQAYTTAIRLFSADQYKETIINLILGRQDDKCVCDENR